MLTVDICMSFFFLLQADVDEFSTPCTFIRSRKSSLHGGFDAGRAVLYRSPGHGASHRRPRSVMSPSTGMMRLPDGVRVSSK